MSRPTDTSRCRTSAPSVDIANPGDDVSALQRLQSKLIYGGGAVLTFIILSLAIASVCAQISAYKRDQLDDFNNAKLALDSLFMQRDAGYVRTLSLLEYAWHNQRADLQERSQLSPKDWAGTGNQVTIQASPKAMPLLVLGSGIEKWSKTRLNSYLGLIKDLSVIAGTAISERAGTLGTVGYFYDPSRTLFAFGRGISEADLYRTTGATNRAELFARLAAPSIDFGSPTALRHLQHGTLNLPFYGNDLPKIITSLGVSPVSGEPAIVGSFAAMDEGQPIGAFVLYEPVETFLHVLQHVTLQSVVLMDNNGKVVFGTGSVGVTSEMASAFTASSMQDHFKENETVVRKHGRYFIRASVAGTDWSLIRSFTYADVAKALAHFMAAIVLVTLLLLTVLWVLLLSLHRRIFVPTIARARQVYQSEELNRSIIRATPVGLALVTLEMGEPILQNRLMREYARLVHTSETSLYQQLLDEFSSGANASMGDEGAVEFQITLPGVEVGAERHVLVAAMPMVYRDSSVVLFVLRDVTARVELEMGLREATRAADIASRAKSSFVAMISHEIRTPLNGIMGHLQLLGRTGLTATQCDALFRVQASADSLLSVVSDVLDLTKIEAGKLDIELVAFELRQLSERVLHLYAPAAHAKGLRLFYRIDPLLSRIYVGGASRIEQILRNLLNNAVKFTHSGKVTVRISGQSDGDSGRDRVKFEVVDSGIGVSAEQAARVFEPFAQADTTIEQRFGGSGLGLALCRQLSLALGGSVSLSSTPHVGSVFTLEVPLVIDTCTLDMPKLPLRGMQILLLSSAAEWREEICDLLEGWGAQVVTAAHPSDLTEETIATASALVIFDEPWGAWMPADELPLKYVKTVRALPEGNLFASGGQNSPIVSCYASNGLLHALLGTHHSNVTGVSEEGAKYLVGYIQGPSITNRVGRPFSVSPDWY